MKAVNYIALIDSGINTQHFCSMTKVITGINLTSIEMSNDFSDNNGHGTACAFILFKLAPQIHLHCIKIFNETLKCDLSLLEKAINYCIENNYKIINLSLGITSPEAMAILNSICRKAISRNIIIVAANSNTNIISYPACFKDVFGVVAINGLRCDQIIYNKMGPLEFGACGFYNKLPGLNGKNISGGGNSFAAPTVTAWLSNLLLKYNDCLKIDQIRELAESKALKPNDVGIMFPKMLTYHEIFNTMAELKNSNDKKAEKQKIANYLKNNHLIMEYKVRSIILTIIGDKKFSISTQIYRQFNDAGYRLAVISDKYNSEFKNFDYLPQYKFFFSKKKFEMYYDSALKILDFDIPDIILLIITIPPWKQSLFLFWINRSKIILNVIKPDAFILVKKSFLFLKRIINWISCYGMEKPCYLIFNDKKNRISFKEKKYLNDLKVFSNHGAIEAILNDFVQKFSQHRGKLAC